MSNILLNIGLYNILLNSSNISEYEHLIDKYGKMYADIYIHPIIFAVLVIILSCVMILRYFFIIKIDGINSIRKTEYKKRFNLYVLIHCLFELLIAFIISYTIIKITGALKDSYIVNWIFAPGIGVSISILIDDKIFIPMEESSFFLDKLRTLFKKKPKNNKSNNEKDNKSSNTININIGSNNTQHNLAQLNTDTSEHKVDHITKDDLYSDEFDSIVQQSINILIDNQISQSKELEKQSAILDEQNKILDAMRETMMLEKKLELKKLIYECLSKGYATPDEDETIRTKYHSYRKLNGNHDVQELYEIRYNKIPIRKE